MNDFYTLRIAALDRPTRDATVLSFDLPSELAEPFRFQAGQYLTLRTTIDGEEIRRPYSICSAPDESRMSVAIKRVAGGTFSNWANEALRVGDCIEVSPPQGRFTLQPNPEAGRHYLAFAAGSGITPIMAIAKTALAKEPRSKFTLFYGNRAHGTTLFRTELCELKDRYLTRFQLGFVMSREHQDLELLNGRIDGEKCAALFARWVRLKDIDGVFVCGPEAMMASVLGALETAGYPKERIKAEHFVAAAAPKRRPAVAGPAAQAPGSEVVVVLDGQRRSFRMAREITILDAAAQQGIELPHSCKGGICSTCRAKLTEGEVEMDTHYALEDYELARGYVLCCQSYPLTDRVVVDFDLA